MPKFPEGKSGNPKRRPPAWRPVSAGWRSRLAVHAKGHREGGATPLLDLVMYSRVLPPESVYSRTSQFAVDLRSNQLGPAWQTVGSCIPGGGSLCGC